MLVRFDDPAAGRVTLGGIDVRELHRDDLRHAVRLVASDEALFTTTVAENVRLARPGAGDADVEGAIRSAGLGPWLDSLPDGLDTLLGEDGTTISGGQRRRLAVARVQLSDARFLIVDEPGEHLDRAAADRLLRGLAEHARQSGKGLLAIVHDGDLSSFDRVLELRDGLRSIGAG